VGAGEARGGPRLGRAQRRRRSSSFAYSDSIYDLPLLSAVQFPHAVNPDPRCSWWRSAARWPILHFDVPPGVPKFAGLEPQKALHLLARPSCSRGCASTSRAPSRSPPTARPSSSANHRSYFDPLAIGWVLAQVGRPVRFLGKKEVFDAPGGGPGGERGLGRHPGGAGLGSDEPLQAAAEALGAGEAVAIMPQGTIPRGRAFFEPELKGRWGARSSLP
jgi:putative phosphoserine phosphatase / 1-acylglycerol-3-phosphate O-acyltransferase